MLANELMIDAYGRIKDVVHSTVKGLDKEQLTKRIDHNANTIAWLIWHLARVQDDHIAAMAETEQIWHKGWSDKFNLPFNHDETGYGQSPDEVGQVKVTSEQLLGYYDEVHEATISYLKHLKEEDYQKVVDNRWQPPVTLAVRLVSVLSDDLQHVGQAAYVRGLIE